MTDRDRFNFICRAIWGDEWHRPAARHLGKARRTIVYWAKGDYAPKDWRHVFLSLLKACEKSLAETNRRRQAIIDFKRTYSADSAGR